jgi:hypothetical protein
MGRASLLQVSRERIQALSDSAPPAPEQPQSRTDLATLCVDAAKATIELILVLKKHNLLCRFSFTDHHASAAALIILILHSILQHGDETSRIIDEGVDMLRYMAHGGCRGASSDLHTIEQLRRLASDLRQKIYRGQGGLSVGGSMQPTSITTSYQAWVNWMSEQESSRSHESRPDNSCSQLDPGTLPSDSGVRAHESSRTKPAQITACLTLWTIAGLIRETLTGTSMHSMDQLFKERFREGLSGMMAG